MDPTVCGSINLIKNFNHILLLQNTSWANETKLLMPITFAEQRKLNKTHGELRAARGVGERGEGRSGECRTHDRR